jgi:hypothetical protein
MYCFRYTANNEDHTGIRGGTLMVAQLAEELRYKPEGREFDSRWYHWNFLLT